jgi:very-short-patch-repair endonuclease
MRAHDIAVAQIAAAQCDAFTWRQALAAGMSPRTFQRRVTEGVFMTTGLPEVYRMALSEETWHQRLWIAHLWAGEQSALSHASAAALYGLDDFQPGPVELIVPRGSKHRVHGVAVHQADLRPGDVRTVEGLQLTSPERTLLDLAVTRGAAVAEDAAECAIYRGLTKPDRILERLKGHPGTAALRRYLEQRGDGRPMASKLERAFWRLMRGEGLEGLLVRQFEVRIEGKRFFLDGAIPSLKIAVELDGLAKRTSRSATNAEYRRQNRLILDGWTVLRFTWDDVMHHPEFVIQTIRDAVATALAAG